MSQTPSITVVVPYYNEQDNLKYLLDQLAAQTLQPEEVILVNSGSTDASSALVEEWITNN
ncbi:MAG: glycosyltransferase family 2 protein, partial [Actinomycetota bacterium]